MDQGWMEAGPTGRMEGQADTQPGSPVPRACGGVARWAQRGMGVAGWWAWQGGGRGKAGETHMMWAWLGGRSKVRA